MEPRNFENKIKEQLQNREISPSAASWEKLNVRLEANNNKKDNRFWWLGIAAAVAVGIFIGTSFFSNGSVEMQVVDAPVLQQEKAAEVEETQIASEELEVEIIKEETNFSKTKNQVLTSEIEQEAMKAERKASTIAQNKLPVKPLELKIPINNHLLIKSPEAIAQNTIEDADRDEAEDLLARAQMKIETVNQVSSIASHELLQEVEADLDESFRNQVFDVLKEGFTKVRVAVADRNK